MRYALVDGQRTEARPRSRGVCQCCGGQTIAKCGEHVHNWSKATADVYFDFGDGILWKLDSFEADKTVFLENSNSASPNADAQGELFAVSATVAKRQRQINLGVFTPIRIDDFVTCSKEGCSVLGGFGPGDLSIFRKEFVPVGTVGSRPANQL